MIAFNCPECCRKYVVKDEFAGRTTTCPACKTRFSVPPAVAAPEAAVAQTAVARTATNPWKTGDRVLAHWPHDHAAWYPGTVTRLDGVKTHVRFEDGDHCWLLPDQVAAFELPVGSRVMARWKNGPQYFPGRITAWKESECHVAYDDGDQEWTDLSCLRVERHRPASAGTLPLPPVKAAAPKREILKQVVGFLDAVLAWPSHCPHCRMDIRNGATVCPHCTRNIFPG